MKIYSGTSICLATILITLTSTGGQWHRPAYYYSRVQHSMPTIYGSTSSFIPTYVQPNGPKPPCTKTAGSNEITPQPAGTNNFKTIHNNSPFRNQFGPPNNGFGPNNFKNNFRFPRPPQEPPKQQPPISQSNNHVNSFNQPSQFTVTPEMHRPVPQNQNHNQNQNQNNNLNLNQNNVQNQNQNKNQNQKNKTTEIAENASTNVIQSENINITTSTLYQLPGMDHLKNCVPIPGTDGACVILQDDTKTETETEDEVVPPKPAAPSTKEIIYEAPKSNAKNQIKFKPLLDSQNQNQQNSNYFSYNVDNNNRLNGDSNSNNKPFGSANNLPPISSFARGNNGPDLDAPFNLRNQFYNNRNRHGGFRQPYRNNNGNSNNNNNNNFFGGNGNFKGSSLEGLPSPQAFHSSLNNENSFFGDDDRASEGSEKIPGEKVQPPFDNLPESREFYMRFLKLWSIYHKRYGCSSKPTNLKSSSTNNRNNQDTNN